MSKAWFITGASSGIGLGLSDHELEPGSRRRGAAQTA
jgi:NAD(P)-dependent dehydrogenase (short-subunit alcohol dehydrogenase family)